MSRREDVRREYEELRDRFRDTSFDDFRSGDWFASFVRWVLEEHAKQVDATYIRSRYPGAGPRNQAKKARKIACRTAAIAGGISAGVISGLELATFWGAGVPAPVTVPAVSSAIMADVAFTTRLQLRTTYDLSVIHRAPLSLDDIEDCHLILLNALGIKLGELGGQTLKKVGPRIVAYNVRRLLRSGVRKAIQKAVQRIAGSQVARKITERALMRLLVPGASVVISSGANYLFTRKMLAVADQQMRERGATIEPILRLFDGAPDFPRDLVVKALVVLMEAPAREGWDMEQLDVLRHTQSALRFSDDEVAAVEEWWDRDVRQLLDGFPKPPAPAAEAIVEYLTVAAALDGKSNNDEAYAAVIDQVARHVRTRFEPGRIVWMRRSLR